VTAKTHVLRLSAELSLAAETAGARFQRKASQQIEYWASLGRALENMPGVSFKRIEAALSAKIDFDRLSADERAIALVDLNHREGTRQPAPMHYGTSGVLYEQDERGRLVRSHESGKRIRVPAPTKKRTPTRHRKRAA
jgi:ParD-like antitoxin of type II bacterial toxin-antitoxin system